MRWIIGLAVLYAIGAWAVCRRAGQLDDAQGRGDWCGECPDGACLGDCWARDWTDHAGTPEGVDR
jgi:hypothetical protein